MHHVPGKKAIPCTSTGERGDVTWSLSLTKLRCVPGTAASIPCQALLLSMPPAERHIPASVFIFVQLSCCNTATNVSNKPPVRPSSAAPAPSPQQTLHVCFLRYEVSIRPARLAAEARQLAFRPYQDEATRLTSSFFLSPPRILSRADSG